MLKTNTIAPRMKLREVTPVLAARWLEKNLVNRNVSTSLVKKYAADMKSGRWDVNGETIKLSITGELLDGQHRLKACILADKPFSTVVAMDLPAVASKSVDIGRTRSFADRLGLEGAGKHLKATAALVRALWRYRNGILDPSHGQLAELHDKEREAIEDAILFVQGVRSESRGGAASINLTAASLVFMLTSAKSRGAAETFVQQLVSGEYIGKDDPAYSIRTRILRAKQERAALNMETQVAAMLSGWNAVRKGRPLSKVYAFGKDRDATARWREMEIK